MSKRFIDTGLFDDPWFMDLSIQGKLLWIYFITKCNHAGIIELNRKLVKLQTDIKEIDTVIKELGNRLVTVRQDLYFIPKYIKFQYPNFPQSAVKQQQSAIEILTCLGLFSNSSLTVSQELTNYYDNDNDNDNDNVKEKENANDKTNTIYTFDQFWDLYDKKTGRIKCEAKYKKLSAADKEKIFTHIPGYKLSTPDVKFRKDPFTYLSNRSWEDEFINLPDEPHNESRLSYSIKEKYGEPN